MPRHAVLHRAHSARVRRDVAAEARGALAREHRVDEAVGPGRFVELFERDARLHDCDVVVEIDLEDLVHPLERHDDAALDRDARAGEAGARAPRGERHAGPRGELDDAGDLRRVRGANDREWALRGRGERLVVRVVVGDRVADRDRVRAY